MYMFDELEPRRLFAASFSNGVLTVSGELNKLGHPRADRIVLTDVFANITVIENGISYGPFNAFDIIEINIDTGGGNDKVLSRNTGTDDAVQLAEVINGGSGNDTIEGGDDLLLGDTISGGSGNDYLAGGLGPDLLLGGKGNDRLNGSTFAPIDAPDGSDTLVGGSGIDIADYTAREDNVYVSNDNVADDGEYVLNLAGLPAPNEDDFVEPDVENIYGGSGNDALVGAAGDSYIDGGAGNDGLFGEIGNDTLVGGKGNDTLCGGTGNDSLMGGVGDDHLLGDYRFLQTGTFDPIFDEVFSPGNDTLLGGDGNDFIRGGGDAYFAASGNDVIDGGNGDDSLLGEDGNDSITGGDGTDLLFGDIGNDTLLGGNGDDLFLNQSAFQGFPDSDLIDGGSGFNIAQADPNDTVLTPGSIQYFFDILDLPSGAPVIPQSVKTLETPSSTLSDITTQAKSKVVEIDGTSKGDAISITESGGIISVDMDGTVTTYASGTVKRFVVEGGKGDDYIALQTSKGKNVCSVPVSVIGAAGNDTIIGGSNSDTLYGGDGNDSINAGSGNDSLFGNTGNDTLLGADGDDILNGGGPGIPTGDGSDVLSGGAGSDSADYSFRTDNLTITMGDDKANDGAPGEKDNVESDIENLFSGNGNDNITGNAASNFISGSDGADTIHGGDGNDKLLGGAGKDTVDGDGGINLFLLQDGSRDDFDAPVGNLAFGATQFISGDNQIDYSTVSQQLIGR
jgi:Ca2+-binding RTX toxin-like protein